MRTEKFVFTSLLKGSDQVSTNQLLSRKKRKFLVGTQMLLSKDKKMFSVMINTAAHIEEACI